MIQKQLALFDTLTLRGKEVQVEVRRVPQADLRFYSENPRVYSVVNARGGVATQEEIEETLSEMDHVKQLVASIRANGGLTDPLLVRDGDLVVLEGNSRLAAYRLLAASDPVKWGYVKCKLLPKDIEEDDVFALLGEYHIIGRKDWEPFEVAGYLYRRNKVYKRSATTMAKEMGLSAAEITRQIETYEFMVTHGDEKKEHFSYYWEYLRNRRVGEARKESPGMDHKIAKIVKSGEIKRALEFRDKLTVISRSKPVIKDLATGKRDFEECYERAKDGGAANVCLQKIVRFREWIVADEREDEVREMGTEPRKKCEYELGKIGQAVKRLTRARD